MAVSTEDIYQAGKILNDFRMDQSRLVASLLLLIAGNEGGISTTEGTSTTSTTGGATASNQASQITLETAIRDYVNTLVNNTDNLETLITQLKAQFPSTLGQKLSSSSLSVTFASDVGLPAGSNSLGTVAVSNFPSSQTVSVDNLPATQPVSGSVTVSNFPATQTVNVNNLPATQVVEFAAGAAFPQNIGTKTDSIALSATDNTSSLFGLVRFFVGLIGELTDAASSTGSLLSRLRQILTVLPASLGQKIASSSFPVTLASDQSTLAVSSRANTTGSGGTTAIKVIATAGTNTRSVKSSAGTLYTIVAIGLTSSVRYLKIYNKASVPTVGTDVPELTIPIPANTQGAGIVVPYNIGVSFSTGIAMAITANAGDTDATAITANDVIVNLTYA